MSNWRVQWRQRLGFLLAILLAFKQIRMGKNMERGNNLSPNLQMCVKNNTSGTWSFDAETDSTGLEGVTPITCNAIGLSITPEDSEVDMCLTPDFGCNFNPECPTDGDDRAVVATDEKNCVNTTCNFENGATCGWKILGINGTEILDLSAWGWKLTQAASTTTLRFEDTKTRRRTKMKDHTLNSGNGYFLFTNFSTESEPGRIAILSTPVIGATGNNCELNFYAHIVPGTVGRLEVIQRDVVVNWKGTRTASKTRQLYSTNYTLATQSNHSGIWLLHSIIWPKNRFYTISLEVTVLSSNRPTTPAGIAIDDIQFRNCALANSEEYEAYPLSGFDSNCADLKYNCMESNTKVECRSRCSTCKDYPSEYCGPGGICVFDNATFTVSCDCKPGWSGIPCSDYVVESSDTIKHPFIAVFITLGSCIVCTGVGLVVYKVFKRSDRPSESNRESFENGYDVTFFVQTPPPMSENGATTCGRVASGNRITNSGLLITDAEWDPE